MMCVPLYCPISPVSDVNLPLQAIKLCAESQLDGPAEKYAVLFVVDDLVRKGTVVKDLDTIELYEWACTDVMQDVDFPETFGVLRLRWVKANPKSTAGVSCLQTCVLHWDLVNAQQVFVLNTLALTRPLTQMLRLPPSWTSRQQTIMTGGLCSGALR